MGDDALRADAGADLISGVTSGGAVADIAVSMIGIFGAIAAAEFIADVCAEITANNALAPVTAAALDQYTDGRTAPSLRQGRSVFSPISRSDTLQPHKATERTRYERHPAQHHTGSE